MKTTDNIVILGAGGHARVVADALKRGGFNNLFFVDSHATSLPSEVSGIKVYRSHVDVPGENLLFVNGLGSVSRETLVRRTTVYQNHRVQGHEFAVLIDPTAALATNVKIGRGTQLLMRCCLQDSVEIGENTVVNTNASIDHDCKIGSHVHIAPGVTISGGVLIEDQVHVGTGVTIIQGIKIGRGAFIGAGAVVVKDVPPDVTHLEARLHHKL